MLLKKRYEILMVRDKLLPSNWHTLKFNVAFYYSISLIRWHATLLAMAAVQNHSLLRKQAPGTDMRNEDFQIYLTMFEMQVKIWMIKLAFVLATSFLSSDLKECDVLMFNMIHQSFHLPFLRSNIALSWKYRGKSLYKWSSLLSLLM